MTRIAYHHIGARGGTFPLPIEPGNPCLADFSVVLYDADADCVPQVIEMSGAFCQNTVIMPFCVGARDGRGELLITYDPYASSLYDINADYAEFASISPFGSVQFKESSAVVETRTVEIRTLETICREHGLQRPDFLSLDVQGGELDVLAGAGTMVRDCLLGVDLEIEFCELYKGQGCFHDIHGFLVERGFELFEVRPGRGYTPFPLPIGIAAGERQLYGDALYLKRIDRLDTEIALYKLALLALAYGQLGHCLACLREVGPARQPAEKPGYARFLDGLRGLYDKWPAVFMPKLTEWLSGPVSKSRFLPSALRQTGEMQALLEEEFAERTKRMSDTYGGANAAFVQYLQGQEETPLEEYLRTGGFAAVAANIARQRKEDCRQYLKMAREGGNYSHGS